MKAFRAKKHLQHLLLLLFAGSIAAFALKPPCAEAVIIAETQISLICSGEYVVLGSNECPLPSGSGGPIGGSALISVTQTSAGQTGTLLLSAEIHPHGNVPDSHYYSEKVLAGIDVSIYIGRPETPITIKCEVSFNWFDLYRNEYSAKVINSRTFKTVADLLSSTGQDGAIHIGMPLAELRQSESSPAPTIAGPESFGEYCMPECPGAINEIMTDQGLVRYCMVSIQMCSAGSCVTPSPTPTASASPTFAPSPTPTPQPSSSPWPTSTALPTSTPLPTISAFPTYTPWPSYTSYPTYTPAPTYSPAPTWTPMPTFLPWPPFIPR
ncbi:MAG TPA: hypothetical protein PLP17_06330 [Oligoflexia bacterium]|nr:hypothetical protein [Oligoflexia bacterium]